MGAPAYLSKVLVPLPQGDLRVVSTSLRVGMRTGPLTCRPRQQQALERVISDQIARAGRHLQEWATAAAPAQPTLRSRPLLRAACCLRMRAHLDPHQQISPCAQLSCPEMVACRVLPPP